MHKLVHYISYNVLFFKQSQKNRFTIGLRRLASNQLEGNTRAWAAKVCHAKLNYLVITSFVSVPSTQNPSTDAKKLELAEKIGALPAPCTGCLVLKLWQGHNATFICLLYS